MSTPNSPSFRSRRPSGLLLALLLALAPLIAPLAALAKSNTQADWIARGGGGGGGRGGGGFGGGSGRGGGGSGSGGRSGFQHSGEAGGLNRGATRPSGGWSNSVRSTAPSPGLGRPAARPDPGLQAPGNRTPSALGAANRTPGSLGSAQRTPASLDRSNLGNPNRDGIAGNRNLGTDDRNLGTDGRNLNGSLNRPVQRNFNTNVSRNWNRDVNINNVNLSPGWARSGWGYARPWSYGWYGGWATPAWGWWGANAALWGVSSLASAAVINAAVDSAVASSSTYIIVPQTSYQLLWGTVQPSGSQGVSFLVQVDGSTYSLSADCAAGSIDGVAPSSAAQAELLNAACQVAYGST
jgi:hypothetical protein